MEEEALIAAVLRLRLASAEPLQAAALHAALSSEGLDVDMSAVKKAASKAAKRTGAAAVPALAKSSSGLSPNSKAKMSLTQTSADAKREFHSNANKFRSLLVAGREKYANGRSHEAVEKQRKALELGSKILPRFEEHSLVKAHGLFELGLAAGAICTDHLAHGDEWKAAQKESMAAMAEALNIFLVRLAEGTLPVYRKEECWMERGEYVSPIPHTERMGPIDYLTCTTMAVSTEEPTVETVRKLRKAIKFCKEFKASNYVIALEGADAGVRGLQSEAPPPAVIENLKVLLSKHERVLAGGDPQILDKPLGDHGEDMRHSGTLTGEMLTTSTCRAADVEERGLSFCAYAECRKQEAHPRQFKTCARCKWASYCCAEHQKAAWKAHKKVCGTVAAQEYAEYAEQRKGQTTLKPGQIQQYFTVVRELHVFCVASRAMRQCAPFPLPELRSVQDHLALGIPQIGLIWDAFFGMRPSEREQLVRRFVAEVECKGYTKEEAGGPPFRIALAWSELHVSGAFAVVEHTPQGSIFLYETASGQIDAYRVVGLSQSMEALLNKMQSTLPLLICTALIPFKDYIVTHGCIGIPQQEPVGLLAAAAGYASTSFEYKLITNKVDLEAGNARYRQEASPPDRNGAGDPSASPLVELM